MMWTLSQILCSRKSLHRHRLKFFLNDDILEKQEVLPIDGCPIQIIGSKITANFIRVAVIFVSYDVIQYRIQEQTLLLQNLIQLLIPQLSTHYLPSFHRIPSQVSIQNGGFSSSPPERATAYHPSSTKSSYQICSGIAMRI